MNGARGLLLLLLCLLPVAPVVAGTLYRCDSADGGTAYVSKRVSGAKCRVVSQYQSGSHQASSHQAGNLQSGNLQTSNLQASIAPASAAPMGAGSVIAASDAERSPALNIPATSVAAPAPTSAPAKSYQAPRLVRGQVYSYIQDGVRHYTSQRPNTGGFSALRTIQYSYMETCYACSARPDVNFGTLRLNMAAFQNEIASAAKDYGVDEAIVRAIIHAESSFNPNALSRVGAQGLMQLMPATARRFGVGNPFDAAANIRGGVQYLAWLLKRFNGDLTLAAAGYNAGEGAVDRYRGVPPYSETQRYVQRVGLLAERYRGSLAQR